MATIIPIWIYGTDGQPLPTAEPEVLAFVDKEGVDRPVTPDVEHTTGEKFTFLPSDDDEDTGSALLIDCGEDAYPRYQFFVVSSVTNPFAMYVPFDIDGNLSAGAPTIGAFTELLSGGGRPAPAVVKAGAHEIYTATPSADDIKVGTLLRFDAPADVYPLFFNASFSVDRPPVPLPPPTTTGEAIRTQLAADATVTALLAGRMFPAVAPQGTITPFLVYQVISDVPENTFMGDSSNRLSNFRVQIDCYSKSYLEAHAAAAAVDAVLSAIDSPDLSCWRESSRDLYDDEAQLHRVSSDFSVWR